MTTEQLERIFLQQQEAQQRLYRKSQEIILEVAQTLLDCFQNGGKVLLFGNGGSAADAQHVAAEFVGRFARERRALPAIALTTDTSILTAVGNDYGFDCVFERQVEALARPGDVVVGISTSGNSPNVLRALEWARKAGVTTIGFTGKDGGNMTSLCDVCFIAPADVTARIQELHIVVWHAVCDLVEGDICDGK